MDCNFKVGQTVWCVIFGEGEVERVVSADPYPVQVYFERIDDTYWYTADGKPNEYSNRTLFFSEPKIEAQEFPSRYIGKTVLFMEKGSPVAYGPSLVIHEYPHCIAVDSGTVHFSDYNVFIVEQNQE